MSYPLTAVALVIIGAGIGLAGTSASDAIRGALPKEKSGVGSAVNDTTRESGCASSRRSTGRRLCHHSGA